MREERASADRPKRRAHGAEDLVPGSLLDDRSEATQAAREAARRHAISEATRRPAGEVTMDPRDAARARRQMALGLRQATNRRRRATDAAGDPKLLEAQLRAAREARVARSEPLRRASDFQSDREARQS